MCNLSNGIVKISATSAKTVFRRHLHNNNQSATMTITSMASSILKHFGLFKNFSNVIQMQSKIQLNWKTEKRK